MNGRATKLCAAMLLAACVSDRPDVTVVDGVSGTVTVEVLGDRFVRTDGRRIPVDAFILEMRMLMRELSREQRDTFLVNVTVTPDARAAEASRIAAEDVNRLLDHLDVMDVGMVKLL